MSTTLHESEETKIDTPTETGSQILIVDDNAFNILALNTLLKSIYGINGD